MNAPDWEKILQQPFVGLILGQRGAGKTALGHRLLEEFGRDTPRQAYILGFPEHLRDELPEWIEVLPPDTDRASWPEDSVVLVHEAHQLLHARRSQDSANIEIDELVTVSRHRNSTVIFETQQSQRLDRNSVTAVDAIILREPALLQAEFERKQMRKIVREAEEVFEQYTETIEEDNYTWREKSEEVLKHAYVHSDRFIGEYPHEIELADHYNDDISKAYSEAGQGDSGSSRDEDEETCLNVLANWEAENRPLAFDHIGAEHDDFPLTQPWRQLKSLAAEGLVEKTYDSNSKTYYRLTDEGWDEVDVPEPTTEKFDLHEKAT